VINRDSARPSSVTVAIGKPKQQVHKASRCGSKQQQRTRQEHSIIACSCHISMIVVLRAHPIRGELHIKRNANGEVATSPPFYNEPYRLHVLFVKAALGTTFTYWSQHHFVVCLALQAHKLYWWIWSTLSYEGAKALLKLVAAWATKKAGDLRGDTIQFIALDSCVAFNNA